MEVGTENSVEEVERRIELNEEVLSGSAKDANMTSTQRKVQRVLLMVGIPGSGKSTVSRRFEQFGWTRINQDELKTRKKCEALFSEAYQNGRNIVVDRCNVTRDQRKPWLDKCKELDCSVGAIVMAVSIDTCVARMKSRTDHETIKPSSNLYAIAKNFASQMEVPSPEEGINFCRFIRTESDIDRVLTELLT
uniref:Uncharacterized protein n=1 Tax=Timspurckia oligopyrenoides TaxID=708627 RepID=A0A7S0ZIR1_9RHOD|mmetsp:Transcript_6908/g.12370  ORF Transcript_6908/g.12370 Transcript_6908/m.12370 type:complete len:192 (+) Transcript_6908:159-734(+)